MYQYTFVPIVQPYSPENQERNHLIITLSVICLIHIALAGFLSVFTCILVCFVLRPVVSSIPHIDSFLFLSDFYFPPHSLVSRPSQPPPSSRTCWVWYAGAQALRLMVRGAPVPPLPPPKPPTFPCRVSMRLVLYLTCNYMYVCAHGCCSYILAHLEDMKEKHPVQGKSGTKTDNSCLRGFMLRDLASLFGAIEPAAATTPHLMSVDNMALLIYLAPKSLSENSEV